MSKPGKVGITSQHYPVKETPATTARTHFSKKSTLLSQLEHALIVWLLRSLDRPNIFVRLPNGQEIFVTTAKPSVGIIFHNHGGFWRTLINPSLKFGEQFSAGNIEIEGGLVEFLMAVFRFRLSRRQMSPLQRYFHTGIRHRTHNDISRSKKNVHYHYDIANQFYKLWLDENLVYTCAYFTDHSASLEKAQIAKMDYVCRKLRLKPGESVVEAGCGWGALACHMARNYGVKVKAYNNSHEQVIEADSHARRAGLQDQVQFIEDDYRNISGSYDVFVSVGMLEHVGTSQYRKLGEIIDDCLTAQGRGLLHTIGKNQAVPLNPWLVKHIFPGSYAPTLGEITRILEPFDFSILDVENLRLHYARTVEHWLERFNRHEAEIHAMFDAAFVRAWRLYLSSAIVSFAIGDLQLFQVLFARAANNTIPLTRSSLYTNSLRETQVKSQAK